MTGLLAEELFARHLDLTPLRSRPRGLVRCIFHRERTASLSVDTKAGVFHCFGCGEQGGVRRFAELVGERIPEPPLRSRSSSPLAEARARVIAEARRQPWADQGVRLLYELADWIRVNRRKVKSLQFAAHVAGGPDAETTWETLQRAARADAFVNAIEAELDAVMRYA